MVYGYFTPIVLQIGLATGHILAGQPRPVWPVVNQAQNVQSKQS